MLVLAFAITLFSAACTRNGEPIRISLPASSATGPLRPSTVNPRYFSDPSGKIVYLAGSHTWNNFQDWGFSNPPPLFDYPAYLNFLNRYDLNFFRLWTFEQTEDEPWSKESIYFTPLPYLRTGPGNAIDGGLKFDLTRYDERFFTRLRERVQMAGTRGIYVSIMLFDGEIGDKAEKPNIGKGNPWRNHPYHRANNVNGIDGDLNGDGQGWEIDTLQDPRVLALQEAYVAKIIDTVNDLDNVLYEVSNETTNVSVTWQYEIIRFVHNYEKTKPKQHPVGMTSIYPDGRNADLRASPADWISPAENAEESYKTNPPAADGRKVIVADTDHLWGIGGDVDWVWKSFTRGLNLLFMDPYKAIIAEGGVPLVRDLQTDEQTQDPKEKLVWEDIRKNLLYTRLFAARLDLAKMIPQPELSSTRYCLADPGTTYLVFLPSRRRRYRWLRNEVKVDLRAAHATLRAEWFDPETGKVYTEGQVNGGRWTSFEAPFWGAAVLQLKADNPRP